MGLEERFQGIITAGYTIMPEDVRRRAVSGMLRTGEELLIGQDKALMQVEDPKDGRPVPLMYPALRAGIESEALESLTVVGSDAVGRRLPELIAKAYAETGRNKQVIFARMHYPAQKELMTPSRTKRMDLEAMAMAENLKSANRAPPPGVRVAFGADLMFLDGATMDSMIGDIQPLVKAENLSIFYPLVAKETLGRSRRLKRQFLRIIDDKFGSGIYKKDIYGRISLKEANVIVWKDDVPDEVLDFVGSLYSLRKLSNPASLFKALDIIGNDAAMGDTPIAGPMIKKALAGSRAVRILTKYMCGTLSINYAEDLLDRMVRGVSEWGDTKRFSFFEMKYPAFCQDLDSMEDLSEESVVDEGNLRANFSHLVAHPDTYLGRSVLLRGTVSGLRYMFDSELKAENRALGLLSSILGYKEIRFRLQDGSDSIPCYRFKYRNMGPNALLGALVDRIYIRDEESDLLDINKEIGSIVTMPKLKYEELTRDLSIAQKKADKVYIGGKVTGQGIWLHEIILPSLDQEGLRKYYFRQHCPDTRCLVQGNGVTLTGRLQSAIDQAWQSPLARRAYHVLKRE